MSSSISSAVHGRSALVVDQGPFLTLGNDAKLMLDLDQLMKMKMKPAGRALDKFAAQLHQSASTLLNEFGRIHGPMTYKGYRLVLYPPTRPLNLIDSASSSSNSTSAGVIETASSLWRMGIRVYGDQWFEKMRRRMTSLEERKQLLQRWKHQAATLPWPSKEDRMREKCHVPLDRREKCPHTCKQSCLMPPTSLIIDLGLPSQLSVVTAARRNFMSTILLVPIKRHMSNAEAARDTAFWKAIVRSWYAIESGLAPHMYSSGSSAHGADSDSKRPAVIQMGFNFGKWEENGDDCHAHFHFELTGEAIQACNDTDTFKALRGSHGYADDEMKETNALKKQEALLEEEVKKASREPLRTIAPEAPSVSQHVHVPRNTTKTHLKGSTTRNMFAALPADDSDDESEQENE